MSEFELIRFRLSGLDRVGDLVVELLVVGRGEVWEVIVYSSFFFFFLKLVYYSVFLVLYSNLVQFRKSSIEFSCTPFDSLLGPK